MFESLYDSLPLYKLGVGRMIVSNNLVRAKAEKVGDQTLVDHCDVAAKSLLEVRQTSFDYQNDKKNDKLSRGAAAVLDNKNDRTIGQVHQNLKGFAEMEGDSPQKKAGAKLIDKLFPNGAAPYITLEFEEQHTVVEELVDRALAHGAELDLLGTRAHVENLARINTEFGAALETVEEELVSWDDVKKALNAAREDYARVPLHILDHYADDLATRLSLLAPIIEQNERVARYMKQRGTAPDVDPDTGEELDEQDDVVVEPVA